MLSWRHPRQPPDRRYAVVVAGGPVDASTTAAEALAGAATVIAADQGADRLAAFERRPDVLVGDLDSILPETLAALRQAGIPVVEVDTRKDFTDGELALNEALSRGFDDVVLLGWLGGERIDQSLANQLLLGDGRYSAVDLTVLYGALAVYTVRNRLDLVGHAGDQVSVVPITNEVSGITTVGLEYPLMDESLWQSSVRGISNVMLTDRAEIRVRRGVLQVFHFQVGGEHGAA